MVLTAAGSAFDQHLTAMALAKLEQLQTTHLRILLPDARPLACNQMRKLLSILAVRARAA